MKGQSKTGSALEAFANIAAGVAVAFVSQIVIFGYYGIEISYSLNAKMTAWFTAVSLLRQFVLRRIFNRITYRGVTFAGFPCKTYIDRERWITIRQEGIKPPWVNIARDGRAK